METALTFEDNVTIVTLTHEEAIEALLRLFEQVAVEQGWQSGNQLRAYSEQSIYFAVTINGDLVGGVQLVVGSTNGLLPCLTVWPELGLSGRTNVTDLALIAFLSEYRGKCALFWRVLVEVWRYCHQQGINELWMEITPRILKLYRKLGWPLEVMGPLRHHWGEECYPCMVDVQELEDLFIGKARQSSFYQELLAQAQHDRPHMGESPLCPTEVVG